MNSSTETYASDSNVRASIVFFFQAEDGIRDLVRSRGLGDVYKRQHLRKWQSQLFRPPAKRSAGNGRKRRPMVAAGKRSCLLYTSDAADERSSVDLGGRRIIKKKTQSSIGSTQIEYDKQDRQLQHTHIIRNDGRSSMRVS